MASDSKKLQSYYAFNAGEYSNDLAGRTDLESFGSSSRYMSNFLSQVTGGLKKFYGTRHITEKTLTTGFSKIKLIPFINKYEPMALVFYGRDDNYSSPNGTKIGLIYGDSYKDLTIELPNSVDVNEMRWQQINDRLLICHSSTQPMAIDFYGIDAQGNYDFRSGVVSFSEIPYFPIGATDDFSGTLQASALSGTVTMTLASGSNVGSYFPALIIGSSTYTRSYHDNNTNIPYNTYYISNSTVSLFRIRSGATSTLVNSVQCNNPSVWKHDGGYTIDMTDTISQEKILQAIQTVYPQAYINDGMVILQGISDHQNGDIYYMTLNVGRGYWVDAWSQQGQVWAAATYTSEQYTPQPVTTETIDAVKTIGRKIKFYFNDDTTIEPWYQSKTVAVGDYAYSNGHWYKAMSAGSCGNVQPSHTYGVRSDGAVAWKYVHSGSTSATVISVPSTTTIQVLVPDGQELPNNTSLVYKNYAWSIWGKDGVHPSQIYMVGNRLGLVCNTRSYGSWNAMSVTDNYFDFSTEEYGEQLDTSAIVNLIGNNESSDINWVLARKNLYMGGYSGEYYIKPQKSGVQTGVYTPTTIAVENVSNMGGKSVVPLKYKELNMFVGLTGKELYTIAYDYTTDDYAPKSLGYMTQHIMERGIKRMEAVNNLDRNIYLVHDNGTVSLFNYAQEQKVMGFSELDFGDALYDFCSTYAKDEVAGYVAVKRNTGKVTFERFAMDEPNYIFDEKPQGDGVTLASFQPMIHFANRRVYIRYGDDLSQFTEAELGATGDISHDPISGVYLPQSKKFLVGIPMVAELHTQPAFGSKVEGHQQQSISMYIRLTNSGAFDYGSSADFTKYFKYEYWNAQQEYGAAHRLYTGDAMLNVPVGYAEAQNQGEGPYPNTSGVGINIKSDTPEPLNILSIQEIYK